MISLVLLLFFVGFLFKSFNRGVITITIWMPVLYSVIAWNKWELFPILAWIALALMIQKMYSGEIKLKDFPLKRSFIFGSITYFISILICHNFLVMRTGLLIGSIIFPFLSWFSISREKDLWKIVFINFAIIAMILTICGIVELALGVNVVSLYLENNGVLSLQEVRDDYIRFGMVRCRSITAWCSTYGVICILILVSYLLLTYYNRNKTLKIFLANNKCIYILCALLFIGIISTGTRSIYTTFIIALIPFASLALLKPKYIVGIFIVLLLIYYNYIDLFNEILDSFINHEEVQGSSVDLRQTQFDIAYEEFSKSPIWGHGYWAIHELKAKRTALMGAESVIFSLIVDRGLLGVISFIFFNWEIVQFLRKQGNSILIFVPTAFMIGKLMSAFINIDTTYILFYVFIINQAANEYKQIQKNSLK